MYLKSRCELLLLATVVGTSACTVGEQAADGILSIAASQETEAEIGVSEWQKNDNVISGLSAGGSPPQGKPQRPDALEKRIQSTDIPQLERWTQHVITTSSLDDVFAD